MIYLLSIILAFFTVITHKNTFEQNDEITISFVKPVHADAEITSEFGLKYHPVIKEERMHHGIDFKVNIGDQVFAAGNGTVIFAGQKGSYGNMIEIQHEDGFVTRYAHLSSFQDDITEGSEIKSGQHIANAGNSGSVTGPTLHFEMRLNGEAVDPLLYID